MAQQIPYQLDTLGWMQFEYLVQVLLKAALGIGVEAWGGSADHGKDAYCAHELNFPSKHSTNPGPFVFQAKFITNANSTGASYEPELKAAVKKEATLIHSRIENGRWSQVPKHYALFTNAPLTASVRKAVAATFSASLPDTLVTINGAIDICALIDGNIEVARTLPQILSLRNLTELLRDVVRNDSLQRSDGAIREAEALTQVFVPTAAYSKAWQVAGKHNFVVLEGQPEMGKTAIAWMMAAVQLAQKWEAIDCDFPNEFFKNYCDDRKQIFIADDAFGTTEYDTTRAPEWGRQLHKVLPKLNKTHWLVWTTRTHILRKALEEMPLQGRAQQFPKPAEVTVNAAACTREERAMMLYRHAKAGLLEDAAKALVKKHAASVIDNPHFTPERIKNFVSSRLPELAGQLSAGEISASAVAAEIREAIDNPTERMQKAFNKLATREKWLLISLVDCDRGTTLDAVEASYRRFLQPDCPVANLVELLREAFIESKVDRVGRRIIEWSHPSYRDLVIQQLESDEQAAEKFLTHCSFEGLRLAISVAGGARGERRFPLMSAPKSWDILPERVLNVITSLSNDSQGAEILRVVRTAVEGAHDLPEVQAKLATLLEQCCDAVRVKWDSSEAQISSRPLQEFFDSSMRLSPPPRMPRLHPTWERVEQAFTTAIENATAGKFALDADEVTEWVRILDIIEKSDRRLLYQHGFPDSVEAQIRKLCDLIHDEVEADYAPDNDDDISSEADRFRTFSKALDKLVGLIAGVDGLLEETSLDTYTRSEGLLEQLHRDRASNGSEEMSAIHTSTLDLDRFFSDL